MLDRPYPVWGQKEGDKEIPQFAEETHRYLKEAYATASNHLQQAHHKTSKGTTRRDTEKHSALGIGFCCMSQQSRQGEAGNWLGAGGVLTR